MQLFFINVKILFFIYIVAVNIFSIESKLLYFNKGMSRKMGHDQLKQIIFREDVPTDVKDVIKEYLQDTPRTSAEKLVEDNEILSTVLETSPVGIGLFTGPILGWTNDALAQMIGYKSDFLSGKKIRILFPNEEEYERVIKELLDVPEKIRILKAETTWLHQDGSMINVLMHARPIDISDAGKGVIVTAMDITERKKTEEEIKKFKTIADNAKYGVTIANTTGKLTYVNEYFAAIHGYKPDEVIGKNLAIFHDEEQLKEVIKLNTELIEKGSYNAREMWHTHKDGSVFPMLMSGTLVKNKEDIPLFIAATAIDITERKEMEEVLQASEQQYRTIINSIGDAIHVVDKDLRIILVNPALEQRARSLSLNTFQVGKKVNEAFPFVPEKILDEYRQVFNTGETLITEECLSIEGKEYFNDVRKIPILNQGNVVQVVTIIRNATKRKRAEEVLQQRTQELRERVKELNCLYSVSKLTKDIGRTQNEIIHETLQLIPPAWQYPEITCARITFMGKEFTTDNYQESHWVQTADIVVSGEKTGAVEVYYLVEMPEIDEGPFHKEERKLIDALTREIAEFIERKQVEDALRASEEKYRTILEDIEEGYLETDLKGNFNFFNDALCTHLGYSENELLGINFRKFLDTKTAEIMFEAFNTLYETGVPIMSVPVEIRRKDGTKKYFELSASLIINSAGEVIGYRGIIRDVTERRMMEEELQEREQRLREVTENMFDMVSICDMETIIQYVSPSHKFTVGYEPEYLLGKSIIDFLHPDDLNEVLAKIQEGLETLSPKETQVRYRCANGDYKWIETMGKFILDDEGNPFRMIFSSRDITERKKAEE